jgi:threonine/homoserine/homoserine lactone efflux protein
MNLTGIFFSSFIIAFSGAMMPGPMFTATLLMSSKKGFISGPLIVMGHGTLEALLVILLYLGAGELLKNHTVMGSIGIIGGITLLWMAYEAFRFSGNASTGGNGRLLNGSAYVAGIVTSLSNPYWVVWWVTIGLSYIVLSFKYGIRGIIIFYAGHILADLVWYSIVALSFSFMKRFISTKGFRVITIISGIIFAGFSVYFVLFGLLNLVQV